MDNRGNEKTNWEKKMKKMQVSSALILALGLGAIAPLQVAEVFAADDYAAMVNTTPTRAQLDRAITKAETALTRVTSVDFVAHRAYLRDLVAKARDFSVKFERVDATSLSEMIAALNEGATALYLLSGTVQTVNTSSRTVNTLDQSVQNTEYWRGEMVNVNDGLGSGVEIDENGEGDSLDGTGVDLTGAEINLGSATEDEGENAAQENIMNSDSALQGAVEPVVTKVQTAVANESQVQTVKTETARLTTEKTANDNLMTNASNGETSKDVILSDAQVASPEEVAKIQNDDVETEQVEVPRTGEVEENSRPSMVAIVITVCVVAMAAIVGIVALVKHIYRDEEQE